MEMDFVRQRITELRIKKGISELAMSTELGHSRSYITHITSGRSNPSVQELLYIIEYLGVTPQIFFTEENSDEPILLQKIYESLLGLSENDLIILLPLINRLEHSENK